MVSMSTLHAYFNSWKAQRKYITNAYNAKRLYPIHVKILDGNPKQSNVFVYSYEERMFVMEKEIKVVLMFPLMVAETDSNDVIQHFIDCEADHAAIEIH